MPRYLLLIWCLLLSMLTGASNCFGRQTFVLAPYYRTAEISGLTYPRKEMTVTSEVSGRCVRVYHDVGDVVADNGRLVEVDATFLLLDLEANELARSRTRKKLEQEQKSLQRYSALRERESTTEAEYEKIALEVDLTSLTLKELKNQQARLTEKLQRHTIVAPVGWQIIERYTEPGEFILEGQKVARLGDFQELLVRLSLSYHELEALQALPLLELYLPELEQRFNASLYQVSPSVDPATRKIPVEIAIDRRSAETSANLRAGMRAVLEFKVVNEQNGYLVPDTALISGYQAHWLVTAEGVKQQVILLDKLEAQAAAIVTGKNLRAGMEFLANPQPAP